MTKRGEEIQGNGKEASEVSGIGKTVQLHKNRYHNLRTTTRRLLVDVPFGGPVVVRIQLAIFLVILLNSLMVILITVPSIRDSAGLVINDIISVTLLVFAIEYLLRLWSCASGDTLFERTRERLRFMIEPYAIIDLIAILPVFLPFIFPADITIIRLVRLLSVFKFMRYARHAESLNQLRRILVRKQEIFAIMVFFLVYILLFSSTIMYVIENHAQPDKFSSIPDAMWWAIMTVTTVGYGDIIPVTPLGRIIGSLFTVAGVMILALPSAILASGFIEERTKKETARRDQQSSSVKEVVAKITLLERIHSLREKGVITAEEEREFVQKLREHQEDTVQVIHENS